MNDIVRPRFTSQVRVRVYPVTPTKSNIDEKPKVFDCMDDFNWRNKRARSTTAASSADAPK